MQRAAGEVHPRAAAGGTAGRRAGRSPDLDVRRELAQLRGDLGRVVRGAHDHRGALESAPRPAGARTVSSRPVQPPPLLGRVVVEDRGRALAPGSRSRSGTARRRARRTGTRRRRSAAARSASAAASARAGSTNARERLRARARRPAAGRASPARAAGERRDHDAVALEAAQLVELEPRVGEHPQQRRDAEVVGVLEVQRVGARVRRAACPGRAPTAPSARRPRPRARSVRQQIPRVVEVLQQVAVDDRVRRAHRVRRRPRRTP